MALVRWSADGTLSVQRTRQETLSFSYIDSVWWTDTYEEEFDVMWYLM